MFIPLPLILIIRLFTAALLLAHTLLFSIPRFFDYRHLATWANAFLLAAALLATFLSLHQLISTTHDDDDDDEIDFAADVPPSKAANPFFASILPAMTYPILQSAGASAIIASVIHWSTADAVPPANSFVQRYVRYSLYAANPALYVLDLVLAASFSPRLRLRNVPFTWLFVAIYYAFVAISDRSQLPSGTRDVATVIAVTVVVPLLLVLLAAFIPSICGVASAAYRSKRKSVPTDDVENNLTHIQASVTTLGPACPEFQPQAIESTHSTLPKPDRPAHPTLESPPPIAQKPDRPTNPSTTSSTPTDRQIPRSGGRNLSSLGSDSQSRSRLFVRSTSVNSTTSSQEAGRERVGSGVFARISSQGSESSAWSGIMDLTVDMPPELFRMPGAAADEGVQLPPRIASVSSTSLV